MITLWAISATVTLVLTVILAAVVYTVYYR